MLTIQIFQKLHYSMGRSVPKNKNFDFINTMFQFSNCLKQQLPVQFLVSIFIHMKRLLQCTTIISPRMMMVGLINQHNNKTISKNKMYQVGEEHRHKIWFNLFEEYMKIICNRSCYHVKVNNFGLLCLRQ